jgi:hypothetical protein
MSMMKYNACTHLQAFSTLTNIQHMAGYDAISCSEPHLSTRQTRTAAPSLRLSSTYIITPLPLLVFSSPINAKSPYAFLPNHRTSYRCPAPPFGHKLDVWISCSACSSRVLKYKFLSHYA